MCLSEEDKTKRTPLAHVHKWKSYFTKADLSYKNHSRFLLLLPSVPELKLKRLFYNRFAVSAERMLCRIALMISSSGKLIRGTQRTVVLC
jgi:hypothetical protein